MAYGDQPALIAELVDWARAAGFDVVAAGKGTKYLPIYHASTPETVWGYYGLTPEQARAGGMNPQMFNSFLDGTKSAIEMAAVANATGLAPAKGGLAFPPCGVDDLPRLLRPASEGGLPRAQGPGRGDLVARARRRGRCSAISAGASTSCSRRRATTSRAASPSTASSPIPAAATPRCTSPIT